MTDKKALEVLESWLHLAYHNADGTDESSAELYEALQTVFDLITRRQMEIEKLKSRNNFLEIEYKNQSNLFWERVEGAKSEAIREFVERLKKSDVFYDCIRAIGNVDKIDCVVNTIDNLVKEMVGE